MLNILLAIAVILGMVSAIVYPVILIKQHGNPTYESTITLMGLAVLAFIGSLVAHAWIGVVCWIICFCVQLATFFKIKDD